MKRLALACLLLVTACAPHQQMRGTYRPTPAATLPQDHALNECRFLVAQNPAAIDWYMVHRFGIPISGPNGELTALTQHGMDQMDRCMSLKGYRKGPDVPYRQFGGTP